MTGQGEALEGLAAMRVQFHLLDAPEPLSWTLIYPPHGELGGGYYFIFIFITLGRFVGPRGAREEGGEGGPGALFTFPPTT